MSAHDSQTASINALSDQLPSALDITTLVSKRGTVPFGGFRPDDEFSYPDDLDTAGSKRFDENPASFVEALEVLPRPESNTLHSENPFALTDDEGNVVDIDTEAIRDVDGVVADDIEALAGASIEQLAAHALDSGLDATMPVETHREIIDPRRLALRTLFPDLSCRYRYYIGSNRYEPGDIHELLGGKLELDVAGAFGWIDYRAFAGQVSVTTIYPSLSTEDILEDVPDDFEIDSTDNALVPSGDDDDTTDTEVLEFDVDEHDDGTLELPDRDDLVVYFGEKITLGFQGLSKIEAHPVLLNPKTGVSMPFEHQQFSHSRKHNGDWTDAAHERDNDRVPPHEWHDNIVDGLDSLLEPISAELIRSKAVAVNFEPLPYSVAEFYEYLGVPTAYADSAATRVERLADGGDYSFSLWALQVGLKLTLLDEFQGDRASDRYHELEELAGQLLRHPVTAIQSVNSAWRLDEESDDEDDGDGENTLAPSQQTLFESLDELSELPGVDVTDVEMTDAQRLQDNLNKQLGEFTGDD